MSGQQTANYGGKQPDNSTYIKQFNSTATGYASWIYKKIGNILFITTASATNVLIQKDLVVNGSINNPSDVKLKELESFLGSLKTKYDESLQKYQEGYNTMSEFERKSQEEELTTMQTRIQTKQQEAQQDYQAFTTAMQKPIYDKVNAAITEVAKEYKYSYVLSKMDGVVLYADPADDILLLVKKQLNKMPAAKLPEVGGGSTKPVPSGQTKPSVPRK